MGKSVSSEEFRVTNPIAAALNVLAEEAWVNQRRRGEPIGPGMNWLIQGWAAEYAWRRIIREIAQRRYCARGFYIGVGEDSRMDVEVETGDPAGEELESPIKIDVRTTSFGYLRQWKGLAYPAARFEANAPAQNDRPDIIVAAVAEITDDADWAVRFVGALEWQDALRLSEDREVQAGHPPYKCLPIDEFKWDCLEARLPLPEGDWSWH